MQALNRDDLQQFIDAHGLGATIMPLSQQTTSVAEAALALGVASDHIIKSLVFMLADEAILVINNGLTRVDRKKLAAHLGVGRKRVKFATPEQALAISGFAVGSMPPFGHRRILRTLVDKSVPVLFEVYGGGGAAATMMRLSTAELIQVTRAEVVDLSADPST